MPRRHSWIALAVGFAAALFVWRYYAARPWQWSDFDQLWIGGRALLAGENPYRVMPTRFPWPLYYPLPAILVGLPFTPLPLSLARCAFAFLSTTVCVWAVLRHRPGAVLPLLAGPLLFAIQRGQWSPLVLTACLIPAWGVIVAIKPSSGLVALAYRPSWIALLGAAGLVVLSLVLLPQWPLDWLTAVQASRHFRSPAFLPGGLLILLAVFRWRRPEARLLLASALIPQTVVPYELVPLALVPETRRERLILTLCWAILCLWTLLIRPVSAIGYAQLPPHWFPWRWWWELPLGYLPCVAMILRRPNVAAPAAQDLPYPPAHPSASVEEPRFI